MFIYELLITLDSVYVKLRKSIKIKIRNYSCLKIIPLPRGSGSFINSSRIIIMDENNQNIFVEGIAGNYYYAIT
jgi:hypothetical protein